jgi:transposase
MKNAIEWARGLIDTLPVKFCVSLEGCLLCLSRIRGGFRDMVFRGCSQGCTPITQIAKDFGVSDGCLSNRLKKRNRLLKQESEVLHHASAYLSEALLP